MNKFKFCFLFLLLFSFCKENITKEKNIYVLNPDNFDNTLKNYRRFI